MVKKMDPKLYCLASNPGSALYLLCQFGQMAYTLCAQTGDKKQYERWASSVVQWLRISLTMQGTLVQSLVPEGPTCHRATKPMCHND